MQSLHTIWTESVSVPVVEDGDETQAPEVFDEH